MGKHIEVKFELINKHEVVEMTLKHLEDFQGMLKKAKSPSDKKSIKYSINFLGSIAKHLGGLTESPKKTK
ncbi:hypothetical protein N9609_00490 [bacterium]|nr:hypothetical protein [bacterium]